MKTYLIALGLGVAAITAPTFVHAQQGPYASGPYGYGAGPYGYGYPGYTTPYGRYPAYTYDPDPGLSAQMRSDFNRGVDATR
jgi:hypothetical protein